MPTAPGSGSRSRVPGATFLAEEYEEQYTESRVTGQTFRAAGHMPPDTSPEPSPRPPPAKRLEFVLMVSSGVPGRAASPCSCSTLVPLVADIPFFPQPPSQRAAEEESTSSTVLSAQPPDTSLSLPTSPDKQPPWPRAFPLPPVEEKQWHQPGSIQTNIVPINVSGRAASHGVVGVHRVQAEMCPSSHLGQGVGGWKGLWLQAVFLWVRWALGQRGQQGHAVIIPSHLLCHLQLCVSGLLAMLLAGLHIPDVMSSQPGLLSPGLSPRAIHLTCVTCLP